MDRLAAVLAGGPDYTSLFSINCIHLTLTNCTIAGEFLPLLIAALLL